MKRFFAIATVSLFLGAVSAPMFTASAQEPQKKECCSSSEKKCDKKASDKKEADKKADDKKDAKKTTRRNR